MKRSLLFLFTVQTIVMALNAQEPNNFISLNNFVPPSPEAAALARYGQMPVSYSSGIPSISIPLYEIKSRKLAVPLSISYHASGIKVEDIATTVGLGWALNAGGVISRNVVGKADENGMLDPAFQYKPRSQVNVQYAGGSDPNFAYLDQISQGVWDSQSDVYDINTPAFTGRFVYDIYTKKIEWTPVDKQLKITRNISDDSFTIIDDNGNKYVFSETEKTETRSTIYTTAWYNTMIISADLTDTIFFKYKQAADFRDAFESQTYSIKVEPDFSDLTQIGYCPTNKITGNLEYSSANFIYYRKLIDTIKYANGFVKFNYYSDRQDPGTERLASIKVFTENTEIKTIDFFQSYFVSDIPQGVALPPDNAGKRLRLDQLKFKDAAQSVYNVYSCEYNTQVKLPYYYGGYNGFPQNKGNAYDLWGYCKGTNTYLGLSGVLNGSIIPNHFSNQLTNFLGDYLLPVAQVSYLSNFSNNSADRYPNPYYTQACMLRKITYPTGGFTQFEYENNKVNNSGDNRDYSGGLRIKRMISFDGIKKPVVNTYAYGDNGTGISISRVIPEDFCYTIPSINKNPAIEGAVFCNKANCYITANPLTAINYYGGSPVFYTKVTEYNGYPGDNQGKTEYSFDYEIDNVYSSPDDFKYWNFSTDKSWARGGLLSTKIYKYENGNYKLLKQVRNTYEKFGQKTVNVGFVCERKTIFTNITLEGFLGLWKSLNADVSLMNYFEYVEVALLYGVKKLTSSEEVTYVNNDSLVTRTEHFYESPDHLYETRTKTYTSTGNGDFVSAVVKYPQDRAGIQGLSGSASGAIDGMISKNILASPVETENYNNTTLLNRNRTEFINWNNSGRFYEQYKDQQIKQNTLEQRVQFKSYDEKGNVTRLSKIGDDDVSYIWDYNGTYPVAQVVNAGDNEIAFESFESTGGGNWTTASAARVNVHITGQKGYELSNGNITKSGLANGKTYVVTYWSQNGGSKLVNGSAGVAKMVKQGWTLFEHKTTSTTATISGSGIIDELRLYPENAMMTSYTYLPLIGVTSVNSPNSTLSLYSYDDAGRLLRVKDADNNILKQMEYKYQDTDNSLANWQGTGNSRPLNNGTSFSCMNEVEQKDINTASPTYNQLRWVLGPIVENPGSWQIVNGQTRCKPESVTGEQQQAYIDQNRCSSSYGQISWVTTGITCACTPLTTCSGLDKKIINGCCETGVKIYTSYYHDNTLDRCYGVYHYEWSDLSWSQDYTDYSNGVCPADQ